MVGSQIGDGVGEFDVGESTHIFSTCRRIGAFAVAAGEVLHDDGIVEHTRMNEQLLLCLREIIIAGGIVPWVIGRQFGVVLEEFFPSFVACHEQGLRARALQYLTQGSLKVFPRYRVGGVHDRISQKPQVVVERMKRSIFIRQPLL